MQPISANSVQASRRLGVRVARRPAMPFLLPVSLLQALVNIQYAMVFAVAYIIKAYMMGELPVDLGGNGGPGGGAGGHVAAHQRALSFLRRIGNAACDLLMPARATPPTMALVPVPEPACTHVVLTHRGSNQFKRRTSCVMCGATLYSGPIFNWADSP